MIAVSTGRGRVTSQRSPRRRFNGNPQLVIGSGLLLLMVTATLILPTILDLDALTPNYNTINAMPGSASPLGTDYLGRDTLARIIYGGRVDFALALIVILVASLVGTILGASAGYMRGWYDHVVMRVMDALLAIPGLVLALSIAFALGASLPSLSFALAVVRIPQFARLARAETLLLMEQPFLNLAVVAGCSGRRILLRHLVPNMSVTLLTQAAVTGGQTIFTAASLSFLGLGLPPPKPTWGGMLREAVPFLQQYPFQALIPGVVIFLAMLSFNLLADGIRNATR